MRRQGKAVIAPVGGRWRTREGAKVFDSEGSHRYRIVGVLLFVYAELRLIPKTFFVSPDYLDFVMELLLSWEIP